MPLNKVDLTALLQQREWNKQNGRLAALEDATIATICKFNKQFCCGKMAVTTKKLAEELDEIKKSLNMMSEDISKMTKQQDKLMEITKEVRELREMIQQKDQKIELLQQRVDDLEQYTRAGDLIITGLETHHRTYARATANDKNTQGEDAPLEELQTLERQVVQYLNSKDIKMDSQHISACHVLSNKDKTKPVIIVQFANRKHKVEVLRQSRKLKGTGVYINEHLTKKNGEIARECRVLRKKKKVQSTWTRNGKVFIKTNGTPEQVKVILINQLTDLEQYK